MICCFFPSKRFPERNRNKIYILNHNSLIQCTSNYHIMKIFFVFGVRLECVNKAQTFFVPTLRDWFGKLKISFTYSFGQNNRAAMRFSYKTLIFSEICISMFLKVILLIHSNNICRYVNLKLVPT